MICMTVSIASNNHGFTPGQTLICSLHVTVFLLLSLMKGAYHGIENRKAGLFSFLAKKAAFVHRNGSAASFSSGRHAILQTKTIREELHISGAKRKQDVIQRHPTHHHCLDSSLSPSQPGGFYQTIHPQKDSYTAEDYRQREHSGLLQNPCNRIHMFLPC